MSEDPPDDRHPITEKEFKRLLEDQASQELFELLRARGHVIDEIRWPDREREGHKSEVGAKTVDLTFREDGSPVGVDIIELHESEQHARQGAEMGRIIYELEQELRPHIRALNPLHTIAISCEIDWLPPKGKAMREALEMVKATVLAAVPGLRDGETVDLSPKPAFFPELRVLCLASPTPKFGFISMMAGGGGLVSQAVDAMVESLLTSSKPSQLKTFSDARVLAVDRVVMPFAEDLRAALDGQAARIPKNWTTIYYMVPWRPGSIGEVWSRQERPHSAP